MRRKYQQSATRLVASDAFNNSCNPQHLRFYDATHIVVSSGLYTISFSHKYAICETMLLQTFKDVIHWSQWHNGARSVEHKTWRFEGQFAVLVETGFH